MRLPVLLALLLGAARAFPARPVPVWSRDVRRAAAAASDAAGSSSTRHGAAAAAAGSASDTSFEDAQVLGAELAAVLAKSHAAGAPFPAEARAPLRALVSSTKGARGWFVTLLTNPAFEAVFESPMDEDLLEALCAAPEPNIRLCVMNVAMSTATELAHLENGNADLAAASRMTRDRATLILRELIGRLPGLKEAVAGLLSAVDPGAPQPDQEWVKFCAKWGYGDAQREAIRAQVAPLLSRSR